MIPNGSDHMIRRALGYMTVPKVGQWARTLICPNITDRDIIAIQRNMTQPRRIGTAKDASFGPPIARSVLADDGTLATRIDAYIDRLAGYNNCAPVEIKGAFGWR